MSITIVTHDNLFHLDDLFACAILSIVFDKKNQSYTIVRTRDKKIIESSDYAVDVGDIYDQEKNRFDHHQKGGAGARENNIPYASAGLVWKKYGVEITESPEIAKVIDQKLIQVLDVDDNGIEYYKNILEDIRVFTIHDFFYTFRPTWREDSADFDKAFNELIPLVKEFILRKIKVEIDKNKALRMVELSYNDAADKRLVVMDKPYPGDDFLMSKPEVLYKISPNSNRTAWGLKTIKKSKEGYENRKDLPASWGGLRDEDLQKLTGVADALFCHNALFLATAASKEGALALAKLALEY